MSEKWKASNQKGIKHLLEQLRQVTEAARAEAQLCKMKAKAIRESRQDHGG